MRFIQIAAIFTVLFTCPCAQSIAAKLSFYHIVLQTKLTTIPDTSLSGVAYDPTTGTLLVIDDGAKKLFEVSTSGTLINTIKLNGFDDIEGISYKKDRYFLLAEERNGDIVQIQLPKQRTGTIDRDKFPSLTIDDSWGNTGLEDVTYIPASNTGYAVKEKDPSALYSFSFNSSAEPSKFKELTAFSWDGIQGDAAGLYVLTDGSFLLLSEIAKTVYGIDINGTVLSHLHVDMNQPEGVTVNEADSTIYLVGEPNEFVAFSLKKTDVAPHSDPIKNNAATASKHFSIKQGRAPSQSSRHNVLLSGKKLRQPDTHLPVAPQLLLQKKTPEIE
jgi:uncharacterized protein YjiK